MPSACRDLLYLRLKLFSPVTLLIRKIIYIVVGMNDGHEWLFKSQQVLSSVQKENTNSSCLQQSYINSLNAALFSEALAQSASNLDYCCYLWTHTIPYYILFER